MGSHMLSRVARYSETLILLETQCEGPSDIVYDHIFETSLVQIPAIITEDSYLKHRVMEYTCPVLHLLLGLWPQTCLCLVMTVGLLMIETAKS